MLDSTGDSGIDKLGAKLDEAHNNGYKIDAHYVTIPPDEGVSRAIKRGEKPPYRQVPETVIRDTYQEIPRVFPAALPKFDTVALYSNMVPEHTPPIVLATGAGGNLTVHDSAGYSNFLAGT